MKFFMENKNQRALTIVIVATVLILVIIFAGVTYAFFTANNPEGSTAQVISENGRMLINYNDGTDNIVPVTGIVPSNAILVNKTFTLTGINTTVGMSSSDGLTMPYKVGVQYTSTFSDGMMHYYIKEVNRPTNSNVTTNYVITPEEGKTEDDYINQTIPGNETYTGYTHGTFKNGKKYTEMVTGEFPASLNNQTITFNLIIQFPDNNENQDSEKGKTFNGKIVINRETRNFTEDSWSTIALYAKEGKSDLYELGAEKEVEIDGTNYTVRVVNNTTPEECNQDNFSKTSCGLVIEFKDIVEQAIMGASYWEQSYLRSELNINFYNSLPSDLQKVITETKTISPFLYNNGIVTTNDKIFLPSSHEIWSGLSRGDSSYNYTRQWDYYKELNVTATNYAEAIKKYNGVAISWWLRSYYNSEFLLLNNSIIAIPEPTSANFIVVSPTGSFSYYDSENTLGVSPAFRIG